MQQHPGEHDEKNVSAAHFWSEHYIRQIKIFCAAFVDFVSVHVTVVSSVKRFKSPFLLSLIYFKEFKKCENNSDWQKLEHVSHYCK